MSDEKDFPKVNAASFYRFDTEFNLPVSIVDNIHIKIHTVLFHKVREYGIKVNSKALYASASQEAGSS